MQGASRRGSPNRHRRARRFPHPRKRVARVRSLGRSLSGTILHLKHVQSAVIVAVAALRQQNCELDEDIATLLQRCVCDRIEDQLEELEAACHLIAVRLHRV